MLTSQLCDNRDLRDEVIGVDDTSCFTSRDVYKSHILDGVFEIEDGKYIDYYSGGSFRSDFYITVYTKEELSKRRIYAVAALKYKEQECDFLTDTFSFTRPYRVSFAEKKPENGDYIDCFAIGVYKNPEGRMYDPKTDGIGEDENDGWRFIASKVYGVNKEGHLALLPDRVGIGYRSELEGKGVYFNDTIVLFNPQP